MGGAAGCVRDGSENPFLCLPSFDFALDDNTKKIATDSPPERPNNDLNGASCLKIIAPN